MKINRCRSQVVRIPADEPLAGGSTSHRPYHHFVILRVETEDGIEGLLKATGNYPDLIIMDLALPEMDGVETARRIHEMPKLSRTPIFVVSALLTKEVEADVRAAGCVEVFAKPFEIEALLRSVRATVNSC